ncbi:hypothetical protein D3C75_1122810 [compost metagenome]
MDMRIVQFVLVFEFTDDFFENVFQGDNTQDFTVFIHDDAEAALLLMEIEQLQLQGRALWNEIRLVASGQ